MVDKLTDRDKANINDRRTGR